MRNLVILHAALLKNSPAQQSVARRKRGRFWIVWIAAPALCGLLTNCASEPGSGQHDPTKEPWYGQTVDQLAALNRQAESFFETGKSDEAAALIQKGESLQSRLLSVPKPSLEAVEAASDLDDLYGRMLLSNHHYGWARLFFQKNLARWKHWTPETPETARRLKQANSGIEECDRHIGE